MMYAGVSGYRQHGDIRECVSSRCLAQKKNYQTSIELQDGYQNKLARDAINGKNIDFLPSSGNSNAEQQNCFFE